MTWDEVRALALALPGVEDGTSYRTPALKVRVGAKAKLLTRLKEDGLSIVLFMDMAEKELLMEVDPDVFFQTPHYEGQPAILARLAVADPQQIAGLLERTWRGLATKGRVAAHEADRSATAG